MALDDVDVLAVSEEAWPSIMESNYRPQSVAEVIINDLMRGVESHHSLDGSPSEELSITEIARPEQLATLHSVKESARPLTILHALLLEDGQSAAQIASLIGCSPVNELFLERLFALRELGLIAVNPESKIDRYSLPAVDFNLDSPDSDSTMVVQ